MSLGSVKRARHERGEGLPLALARGPLQLIPDRQPIGVERYFGQAQAAGQLASAAACSDDGTFDLMMSMHT